MYTGGSIMQIIYTKSYDRCLKKLKKHNNEYNNLDKIIKIIRTAKNFNELKQIPILKKYNFERLKYQYNEFYSLNLNRNGGKIRLIIKPNKDNVVEIFLVFISYDHYDDFDIEKVIYYDE